MKSVSLILGFLVALFLFSCGVRKTELIKEKEILSSKVDSLSLEVSRLKEKSFEKEKKEVKKNIITKDQELRLTPKDSTKPIKVTDSDGKETSFLNAIVDVKTKDKTDNTESKETKEKASEKDLKSSKKIDLNKEKESEKDLKKKGTENEKNFLHYFPFLLFFALLLLLFLLGKRIPFIKNFFN